MSAPVIGMLGASGEVGSAVTQALRARGYHLRLGSRTRPRFVEADPSHWDWTPLDVDDLDDLTHFCRSCGVVASCAGPSCRLLERVARCALATGAAFVDAGGHERNRERIHSSCLEARRAALIGAGMLPGLAGLLPRYVARPLSRPARASVFFSIRDRLGFAGAVDYIAGVEQDRARARGRAPAHGAAACPPFFRDNATIMPFEGFEAIQAAHDLGLDETRWYSVFEDVHVLEVLSSAGTAAADEAQLDAAARALTRASARELSGRSPLQRFVVEVSGLQRGALKSRVLLLETTDAAAVTAHTLVHAVGALVEDRIEPGARFASQALDASNVIESLVGQPFVRTLSVMDGPLDLAASSQEGIL